jgi:hypothetical protein
MSVSLVMLSTVILEVKPKYPSPHSLSSYLVVLAWDHGRRLARFLLRASVSRLAPTRCVWVRKLPPTHFPRHSLSSYLVGLAWDHGGRLAQFLLWASVSRLSPTRCVWVRKVPPTHFPRTRHVCGVQEVQVCLFESGRVGIM